MWNLTLIGTILFAGLALWSGSLTCAIASGLFALVWGSLSYSELKLSDVDWRTVWKMICLTFLIGIAIWAHCK